MVAVFCFCIYKGIKGTEHLILQLSYDIINNRNNTFRLFATEQTKSRLFLYVIIPHKCMDQILVSGICAICVYELVSHPSKLFCQ